MSPTELTFYNALMAFSVFTGLLVFLTLFRLDAPYGRHARPGWGPGIPNRLGWIAMETPAVVVFGGCFWWGGGFDSGLAWVLFAFWQCHYVHRTYIFPWFLRTKGKRMPVLVVGMAILFNCINGYLNGRYLGVHAAAYTAEWFSDPRFLLGTVIFFGGMAMNWWADYHLIGLRRGPDGGYVIPTRGLFRWVSCPNYLGECIEWCGWALLTCSPGAAVFAFWTIANLAPRAYANHRWYRETFPDYPAERSALVPGML